MKITYRGATNFQFLLQSCSNLPNWSLLASNVATNQTMTFIDSPLTNSPRRFYRAVSLPTPFLYQGTFSGIDLGSFILFARTNGAVTFAGLNTTSHRGEYATLTVASNSVGCGTFIAGVPGCLALNSNAVSGSFTNTTSHQTGTVTGLQKSNTGLFNGAAGLYAGTISDVHSGVAKILLCPDGSLAFYRTDSYTGKNDGAITSMTSMNLVDSYLNGSTLVHMTGSFDRPSRTFSLVIQEADEFVTTFSLALSESLF